MTEEITKEKKAVPPRFSTEDLSKEIEQSVERQPDENVKTVRVFGDCYRCNWWVKNKTPQQFWLATGKIRKSRFLRATKTKDGLLVEELGNHIKR
jgi:hypothetical protein